jgi:hypothetical protein
MRSALVLLAFLVLAGCASSSHGALIDQVGRIAQVGAPAQSALQSFRQAGFDCDSADPDGWVSCTRARSHRIVATCIQRARVKVEARRVSEIDIRPPLCAGL